MTTITTFVCLLVRVAIYVAGVAVMTGINLVFSWIGELISAPIPQPKKSEPAESGGGSALTSGNSTQSHQMTRSSAGEHDLDSSVAVSSERSEGSEATERSTELSDLTFLSTNERQGRSSTIVTQASESVITNCKAIESEIMRNVSRSCSTRLSDIASLAPVFRPLRRSISLPNHTEHTHKQKRPSVMLETGLLANVSTPAATTTTTPHNAHSSKPIAVGTASRTENISVTAKDYVWERGLAVGFAITNLIFGIIYYRFLYSSEGTRKAPYAKVIG